MILNRFSESSRSQRKKIIQRKLREGQARWLVAFKNMSSHYTSSMSDYNGINLGLGFLSVAGKQSTSFLFYTALSRTMDVQKIRAVLRYRFVSACFLRTWSMSPFPVLRNSLGQDAKMPAVPLTPVTMRFPPSKLSKAPRAKFDALIYVLSSSNSNG